MYTVMNGLLRREDHKNKFQILPPPALGFTLVELLVVIAIIAILTSIGMVTYTSARVQARSVKRISDLREIKIALEFYYAKFQSYPVTSLSSPPTYRYDCYTASPNFNDYIPGLVPNYMNKLPHDPLVKDSSCSGGGNQGYNYAYASNGTDYKVLAPIVPNKFGGIENCDYGKKLSVEDPSRPCSTSGDPAWAVYTEGAQSW